MVADQGHEIAMSLAQPKKLPLLVFTTAPLAGHLGPPLHLAREMISKGYEVAFMSSEDGKAAVEKIGAEWFECSPFWPPGSQEARAKLPFGLERTFFDLENIFLSAVPSRTASLRALLETVREREPERQVVILAETGGMAAQAFAYGAPLPKGYDRMPKVIGLGVIPLIVTSSDTAPFGPGLPPDSTESGRARNRTLHEMMNMGPFAPLTNCFITRLKEAGCTAIPEPFSLFDAFSTSVDTMFQLCSPSMDYPRSDLALNIRYAGALPPRPVAPDYVFPSWWAEVKQHANLPDSTPGKKKIVVVAQGTVNEDHSELVIPTIEALADREDIILIPILGKRGASLPESVTIPPNTRAIDYLPYDPLLAMSDLFVMNGAYGAFLHAGINGVPVIAAGLTEDKAESSARAEYNGFGINLRTQHPTSEAISEAAKKILADPMYKLRAKRVKQDNLDLDPFHMIAKQIRLYSDHQQRGVQIVRVDHL
ncbi:glycosyltransferase family 1 protein [Xylariaceae sp. FL1019]|nr:glycosyltransferase family 1 protein [Xylariaceae sp. FL1019]